MSKKYDLYCPKHGRVYIEMEKVPSVHNVSPRCPLCLGRLEQPSKDMDKRWQPNYNAEGVNA